MRKMTKYLAAGLGLAALVLPLRGEEDGATGLMKKIESLSTEMDRDFFRDLLFEKNLKAAYQLCQKEDFEVRPLPLFSDEMCVLFKPAKEMRRNAAPEPGVILTRPRLLSPEIVSRPPPEKAGRVVARFMALEKDLGRLPEAERTAVIERFRHLFLSRMIDHLRYKNSLKPRYRLGASLQSQYDSNVSLVSENAWPGKPSEFSGRDDVQETIVLNHVWKPLVNRRDLDGWSFEQFADIIAIHQMSHNENQAMIFDLEPKIGKELGGEFKHAELSYRFQHFGYSGNRLSRTTPSLFHSERLKLSLETRSWPMRGVFQKHGGEAEFSWTDKTHFKKSNQSRDADDLGVSYQHTFSYRKGKKLPGSISAQVAWARSLTENSASSDYDSYDIELAHRHGVRAKCWKNPISFSESLKYRAKSWDKYSLGTARGTLEEDSWNLSLRANTKLSKQLASSLSLTQNWKDQDVKIPAGYSKELQQFQAAIGLNWSIP